MKKSIMFQGTASNVGKSMMAVGLCRILYEKGYKVAPFKAWNMALNSYVTKNGGEVGRAQALQAEACHVDIEVDMQPILVKPKGNHTSQIIMRGKPIGDFKGEYKDTKYIQKALKVIEGSIDSLFNKYDLLVMEGAGSPAEINIKDRDLANMKVAAFKDTPVILVVDIDKGGAFASIIGTLELLEENRKRIKGIIINKFRGKKSSLDSGIRYIEDKTDVPVLGVFPFMNNISLPEEDSVKIKEFFKKEAEIKIGVINLPHLSNFTDFDILGLEPNIQLEYIDRNKKEIDEYDVLIIPGTKNTTEDLKYLKKYNLDTKIKKAAEKGTEIVGICGGYQMLGKKLLDPDLTEGTKLELSGLSLLDIKTVFSEGKDTYQVKAKMLSENDEFYELNKSILEGYEIHMGQTILGEKANPLFEIISRSKQSCSIEDGAISESLNIWGTYMHGIFDNDNFRQNFIKKILEKKKSKVKEDNFIKFQEKREEAFDTLADVFKQNIDMDMLFEIMGIV